MGAFLSQLSYHFDAIHESMKNVRNVTLSSSDDVGCRTLGYHYIHHFSIQVKSLKATKRILKNWKLTEFNLTPRGHPSTLSYDKYFSLNTHHEPGSGPSAGDNLKANKTGRASWVSSVLLEPQIEVTSKTHLKKENRIAPIGREMGQPL